MERRAVKRANDERMRMRTQRYKNFARAPPHFQIPAYAPVILHIVLWYISMSFSVKFGQS